MFITNLSATPERVLMRGLGESREEESGRWGEQPGNESVSSPSLWRGDGGWSPSPVTGAQ